MAINKNLIPFYAYLRGKKILEDPDANIILASSGQYPKYIEPPVDLEYNKERRQQEVFFNIIKTSHFYGWNWFFQKFPKLQPILDEKTTNNNWLCDWADRLYDKLMAYNKLDPAGQFAEDLKISLRKSILGTIVIIGTLGTLIFGVLPGAVTKTAENAFDKGDFASAHKQFKNLPSSYADKMEGLSLMNLYIQEGEQEKAMELASELEGVPISRKYSTDTLKKEVYYKFGRRQEAAKKYFEAASNYKEAGEYLDAQQRLITTGYKAYDELIQEGRHKDIISIFVYLVGYQDSEELLLTSLEHFYQEGLTLFENGDLDKATENFTFLSKYKYKNSNTMLSEATYANGRTAIENKDFDKAIEELSTITTFKDSNSWLKEAHYSRASLHVIENPFEALQSLLKSYGYKESNKLLMTGTVVLFGDWIVTEVNGANVTPSYIRFTQDYRMVVEKDDPKQLEGVFANTPYTLEGGRYVNGESVLETIEVTDINNIKVKSQEKVLTLKRERSISLLKQENSSIAAQDLLDVFFKKNQVEEEEDPFADALENSSTEPSETPDTSTETTESSEDYEL